MKPFYGEFLASIERSLDKHGFPEKRVALPLERLRQAAQDKGLELDKALELLRETGIDHDRDQSRLIFSVQRDAPLKPPSALAEKARAIAEIFKDIDPAELAALQGMNKIKLLWKLRELTKKLTPEQLAKAQELFASFSDEEKAELIKKSKDFEPLL